MSAHVIRLRGFWKRDELPYGRVRLSRSFGRPRTLDPDETVWLVCRRSPGEGQLQVNESIVGPIRAGEPFTFDVTAILAPRNAVWIEISETDGWNGEVELEIRSTGREAP